MKKIKWIAIGLLIILIIVIVASCVYEGAFRQYFPEEGVWYCAELQIYLNFAPNKKDKAIIDGEEVVCMAYYMFNSTHIRIDRWDPEDEIENDTIFEGRSVSLKDNTLVLRHHITQVEYNFVRIE